MKKLSYILTLAIAMFFASCQQTKEGVIADINNLIETIEEDGADFNEKQWEHINEKFQKICEEAEKLEDWSTEEAAELTKVKAKYLGVQMKKSSESTLKKAGKALEGLMEGLED